MGMFDEVRKVPKPNHKRRVKKQKERGKITTEVMEEVWERDKERCVICKKFLWQVWTLEGHHIIFRSQGGTGEPWNVALACGPVTQSGTCHWKAHNTRAGRLAFVDYQQRVLLPLYRIGAS
ncbi:HNH endonuclease [Brevibacillus reuszeri]|uniref:HNH endonuclease n=1 Tax=Brevibacillus reuszeri TaxID=54915 RepID=UPI000CCC7034|nr:HNH endonuclease [Brevibacillus reuszeri]